MKSNPFAEAYKRVSDQKILDILAHQEDYQPLAIEAAQQELVNRQLSEEQLEKIKQINNANYQRQALEDKRREVIKGKVKKAFSFIDLLKKRSPQRSVLIITLILGLFALEGFIATSSFPLLFHKKEFNFFAILDYLLFPTSIILFGFKKKVGYILLNLWIIYKLIEYAYWWYTILLVYPGINLSYLLTPRINRIHLDLYATFLLTGLLIYINTKKIRTVFKASHDKR